MTSLQDDVQLVLKALDRWGLLLLQDSLLPSVAGLIAGGPIKGSWWGHPAGGRIFNVCGALEDGGDVLAVKLVGRKVSFLHRRLWGEIVAVGRAREAWQIDGLTKDAQALLERVDREGRVRASGKLVDELERRLLVATQEVHTASGAHAKELVDWKQLARAKGIPLRRRSVKQARAAIDATLGVLNHAHGAKARLPWS